MNVKKITNMFLIMVLVCSCCLDLSAQDMASRKEFINRKFRFKTRIYFVSGGKQYNPAPAPGSHAPFTRSLLECLRSNGGSDQLITKSELKSYLEQAEPVPRFGSFGQYEPGSDLLLSVGGYEQGKIFALVIGNSEYDEWKDLANPVQDADAVAYELRETYKSEVEVLKNITQKEFLLKLKEYSKKTFTDRDQLIIYYSGHGHFDDDFKEGYLIMKDSRKNDEAHLSQVSQSTFIAIVDNFPSEHIIVIMDGGSFYPIIPGFKNEN